jgi:hypothetical protein
MKFSKEQKEGLARILDTLAISSLIGAIVGTAGYSQIAVRDIVLMFLICPILITFALLLRSPQK